MFFLMVFGVFVCLKALNKVLWNLQFIEDHKVCSWCRTCIMLICPSGFKGITPETNFPWSFEIKELHVLWKHTIIFRTQHFCYSNKYISMIATFTSMTLQTHWKIPSPVGTVPRNVYSTFKVKKWCNVANGKEDTSA